MNSVPKTSQADNKTEPVVYGLTKGMEGPASKITRPYGFFSKITTAKSKAAKPVIVDKEGREYYNHQDVWHPFASYQVPDGILIRKIKHPGVHKYDAVLITTHELAEDKANVLSRGKDSAVVIKGYEHGPIANGPVPPECKTPEEKIYISYKDDIKKTEDYLKDLELKTRIIEAETKYKKALSAEKLAEGVRNEVNFSDNLLNDIIINNTDSPFKRKQQINSLGLSAAAQSSTLKNLSDNRGPMYQNNILAVNGSVGGGANPPIRNINVSFSVATQSKEDVQEAIITDGDN